MEATENVWLACVAFAQLSKFFWGATFGAFVLYILNRLNNRQPFSFFSALQVDMKNRPFRIFLDMIISSVIGGLVVIFVLSPETVPQAVTAGLGLTGILSAFGKEAK